MAENEESYLSQCRQENLCPACRKPLTNKVGSGRFKDGVFCSQACYAKWHEAAMRNRHEERMKKGRKDG